MEKENIIFQKKRDTGDIMSSTFTFLFQEFKPLLIKILIYFGPLGLISGFATANYLSDIANIMKWAKDDPSTFFSIFLRSYSLIILGIWLSYSMLTSVVLTYIALYIQKGRNGFSNDEFQQRVFPTFLKVLVLSALLGILIIIGFIACIIPGIYLSISLSLVFPIIIFEKITFSDAFNKSFTLTHYSWWWTFLLIVVCSVITWVIGLIFSVPNMILTWLNMFQGSKGEDLTSSMKLATTIVAVITTFINSLLYTIPLVAIAFQYFNIRIQNGDLDTNTPQ